MNIKSVIVVLMCLMFTFFAYIFIQRNEYVYAIVTFVIALIFVYLAFMLNKPRIPIPKHIVIRKFIELMEEQYNISILPNQCIFRDEETPTEYVIVLKDIDESDGLPRYFPFECNKYEFIYGRGTGAIKYKVSEVYNWLLQNNRLNLRADVYQEIQDLQMRGRTSRLGGDQIGESDEE